MRILSLFDGISCGRLALERAGVQVNEYIAYEINQRAISVSKNNWKDICHYGDVRDAKFSAHIGVDVLIGGSPCQGLSPANMYLENGEYGVNGFGKSNMFWYYADALKETKAKYFFFENVASMKKVDKDIITQALGVSPVKIDSVLFSPQIRRRLYWTNIPFEEPTMRFTNKELKDIILSNVSDKYYLSEKCVRYIMDMDNKNKKGGAKELNPQFAHSVTASCWKMHRADTDTYIQTECHPDGKTNIRRLTPLECERLQNLPDDYTKLSNDGSDISDRHRFEMIGNGWEINTVSYIFRGLVN